MKYVTRSGLSGLATLAVLALPATAHAHEGDHSATFMANVMHWLSSPTHSLFTVIGGVIIAATLIHLARKSRA